jgi:hypothetical protein
VKIIVNGPYLDAQARIEEFERNGKLLRVLIDGRSVLPYAHEVKLVKAKRG